MRTLIAAVMVLSLVAQADCPKPESLTSGAIANQDDAARLAFLSQRLSHDAAAAHRRTFAFGGGLSLLAIGQLAAAPLFPEADRPVMYWGALSSMVGVGSVLFNPLTVLYAGPDFARRAASATPEQTCELIAEGERMLFEGAEQELGARRWYMHVANVAFNIGIGMILGFVHNRWVNAAVNGVVGIAIGELMLFTIPTGLVSGRDEYRGGKQAVSFHVIPTAGPGLGVLMTF